MAIDDALDRASPMVANSPAGGAYGARDHEQIHVALFRRTERPAAAAVAPPAMPSRGMGDCGRGRSARLSAAAEDGFTAEWGAAHTARGVRESPPEVAHRLIIEVLRCPLLAQPSRSAMSMPGCFRTSKRSATRRRCAGVRRATSSPS